MPSPSSPSAPKQNPWKEAAAKGLAAQPHFAAGLAAGFVSTVALQPLDLIKTRLQVTGGHHVSIPNLVRKVVASEGVHGFYKGVEAAIVGSGLSWGLYFYFYESSKKRKLNQNPTLTRLQASDHLFSAAEAGGICAFATNPIWLVKTRLQLQADKNTNNYRGLFHATYTIVKEEGFFALYKGILPNLLLVSHGAVQFLVYEELKYSCQGPTEHNKKPRNLTGLEASVCGGLSKIVASVTTYPYQVIRSRLQQRIGPKGPQYTGVIDCVKKTFREERLYGFYRGMVPNLLRVVPSSAITFLVYEKTKGFIEWLNR